MLTTQQAAARLGVSITVIHRYYRQGRLPGAEYVRDGRVRRLMIPEETVKNFEHKQRGRPQKMKSVKISNLSERGVNTWAGDVIQLKAGDEVWLVSHYNTSHKHNPDEEDSYEIRRTQPRTITGLMNQGQLVNKGWLGSVNNDSVSAEGKFRVASIGRNVVRFEEIE